MVVENAISQAIADTRYLKLAGGQMTGNITMVGTQTVDGVDLFAWFDQSVKQAASPTFAGLTLTGTGNVTLSVPGSGILQIAGDLFLIDSGSDPRLVLGDSTSAGNWGGIRWVSASDSIGIGTGAGGIDTLLISEAGNVLLASTGQLQFGDIGTYIYQSADSILGYVADGRHEFTGGPVYVGSGTPGHTITGSGDLFVADRLEVDGPAYLDDQAYFYGLIDCSNQHIMRFYGSTFGGLYRLGGDGLHFYVYGGAGSAQNRNIIICDYAAREDDYDHSVISANPTFFIQSITRAGTATNQWLSFAHDQTDAIITNGLGNITLIPASSVTLGAAATNQMVITSAGLTYWIGTGGVPYAEIWVRDNTAETVIGTAGTYVQFVGFTDNGPANNATPDHTQDHITIGHAGVYEVICSLHLEGVAGGAADLIEYEIRTNGGTVIHSNLHGQRKIAGGAGDSGSISISGLADFSEGDTVEVWITDDDNATNVLVDDANLSIHQVGG